MQKAETNALRSNWLQQLGIITVNCTPLYSIEVNTKSIFTIRYIGHIGPVNNAFTIYNIIIPIGLSAITQ